jgi:hypothetical protein
VQILQDALDVIQAAHIAALLFDLLDSAQLPEGHVSGFLRRHPFCDLLLNQFLLVEAEFVAEFLLEATLAKE